MNRHGTRRELPVQCSDIQCFNAQLATEVIVQIIFIQISLFCSCEFISSKWTLLFESFFWSINLLVLPRQYWLPLFVWHLPDQVWKVLLRYIMRVCIESTAQQISTASSMAPRDSTRTYTHLKWIIFFGRNINFSHVWRFDVLCIWRSHWIQVFSRLYSISRWLLENTVLQVGRIKDWSLLGWCGQWEFHLLCNSFDYLLSASILVLDLIFSFDRNHALTR